jgi:hypothetical protein
MTISSFSFLKMKRLCSTVYCISCVWARERGILMGGGKKETPANPVTCCNTEHHRGGVGCA